MASRKPRKSRAKKSRAARLSPKGQRGWRTVPIAYENRRLAKRTAAEVLARESGAREGLDAARSSSGGVVPLRSGNLAEEARGGAEYDAAVAKYLSMLGCPNPARDLATHRAQIDKMRLAKIDPNVAAAIVDASASPHRSFGEPGAGRLEESPTGTEWQVIVTGAPPSRRGQILSMVPPGESFANGNKIVLGGFYDDQEAAHVARAVTRQTGALATYGPKNALYGGGQMNEPPAKEEGSCGCGGSCGACSSGAGTHNHPVAANETSHADREYVLNAVANSTDDRMGLAFVPDVVRYMGSRSKEQGGGKGWPVKKAQDVLMAVTMSGAVELRPEGGLGRLSDAEMKLCLPGPQGTVLSWARLVEGAAEERAVREEPAEGTVCRPFTRVVRDGNLHRMCMARAKSIGEIADPQKIYELIRPDVEARTQESFFVLKIDFRGQLIDYYEVNIGQQHRVAADLLDIAHAVTNSVAEGDKCDGFIIVHNHPSGHAQPSPADGDLTERVSGLGEVIGCPMLDHIVVGVDQYYSFADKKLYKVKR